VTTEVLVLDGTLLFELHELGETKSVMARLGHQLEGWHEQSGYPLSNTMR